MQSLNALVKPELDEGVCAVHYVWSGDSGSSGMVFMQSCLRYASVWLCRRVASVSRMVVPNLFSCTPCTPCTLLHRSTWRCSLPGSLASPMSAPSPGSCCGLPWSCPSPSWPFKSPSLAPSSGAVVLVFGCVYLRRPPGPSMDSGGRLAAVKGVSAHPQNLFV